MTSQPSWQAVVEQVFPTPMAEEKTKWTNSEYDLAFNLDIFLMVVEMAQIEMLGAVENAEAGVVGHTTPGCDYLPWMLHELAAKQVNFVDFLDNNIIYAVDGSFLEFLVNCTDEHGIFNMAVFNALINSTDTTVAEPEVNELDDAMQPLREMTHEQAVAFVSTLPAVDVASIHPANTRCPYCLVIFNEVTEGRNNIPVTFPCASGHFIGFDCLVECLEGTGKLCPRCRQDMVEAAARAQ